MKQELKSLKEKAFAEVDNDFKLSDTTRDDILQCFPDNKSKATVILNSLMIVRDVWFKAWPADNTFIDITNRILEYLEDTISKDVLKTYINKKQTYIYNRIGEGKFESGYAGLALIRAAIEILNEDYNVKDEMDPDQWSSLYIGSLSYSEGAEDIEKIDPKKNKIFWLNFLEVLDKKEIMISNSDNEVYNENPGVIKRNQEKLWKNKSNIVLGLDTIIDGYHQKLLNDNHKNLRIEAYVLNKGVSFLGYYDDEKIDNKKLFFLNKEIKAKEMFLKIRQEMYDIKPQEGTWFRISLLIDKNKQISIEFSYDEYFDFFDTWRDKIDFYEDIKSYPREKKFTPNWLKNIMIHNKPKNNLV